MKNAFILLSFLIGNLGVGNICYAQPSSGTTTFDGLINITDTYKSGAGSASASNVLSTGWTFTVDNLDGTSTAAVQGLNDVGDDKATIDDDVISLSAGSGLNTEYVSVASSDGSEFQLENFKLYYTSQYNAVVTIAGYRDGSEIVSASQGSLEKGVWNTIDVSSNTSFDNIDEIRITYGSPNAAITRIDDISIAPNTPPTFTSLSGSVQSTNEDTGVAITFAEITAQGNEADVDGTVDAFVVKAVSSGTLTINSSAYAATTNDEITAAKSAFWTPAANANGTLNAFTVTAKDDAGDESTSGAIQATVSVTPVNDAPTLTGLPASITVTEDVASNVDLSSATFADLDAGLSDVSLVITAAAGTLSAVSGGGVSISNSGTSSINLFGTASNINTYLNTASNIQYTTASNSNTATNLTFVANDGGNSGAGGGTSVSVGSSVTVNITPVNDEPSFTLPGNNLTVSQNAGATTESAFATGMSDNDGNTQNLDFNVSNDNNGIFSAQPDIDKTSGDLTFTPASGFFGKATVSVSLKDDGEGTPTGDDTSPTQTFDIFVTPDNIKINEVNAASTTSEFVEIYDGGSGSTALSDLVLIFYSGSDASDGVYGEEDLSGSTDADGFYVVGETGVTNLDLDWGGFILQNGTDAVVLYVGSASDFTSGDAPITDGLVDVLVYGSADDSALRTALGGPTLSPAGDASNSISRAIDGTGSFVAQTPSPGVTNDVTPPVSPVVTSPSGSVTVNALSQTLSGPHAEDGVTVHAYADNNNDGVADNTTSLGSSTVSGNAWSFSISLTSDAANNFVVQAEDGAGNVSSDVDVPTITEDSTDPVSPIVTSPSASVIVNSASQTLSGTHTENGVTVHAYADNNNDGVADNTTSLGSSTVSGNSWSFSVSLTSDAANNFVVRAEDGAGNVSSDEDVPTITEDSSRPTLYSSNPADDATAILVGNNLTLTFNEAINFGSGTIEIIDLDNGSSTVTIDVTSPGTQASISGKVLTLNPSSDLEYSTNYAVQIEATAIEDLYGNVYSGIVDNTTLNFNTEDPVIAFSATSSSGAESVSSADLTVEISAVSPRDVTVNYTVGGTATSGGTDYTLADGTLTITAGNLNNVISIADIVDDLLVEANETVIVSIASPSNASLGTNTTHTYTILDDDNASVTIADVSGNEDDGAVTFTATLDSPVAGGFSVDVSTSDGTATAGVDYFAVSSQTLIFAGTANETKTFTVTPKVDSNPEPNETVNVSMSNIGATGIAASKFDITDVPVLTIIDDDASQISISDQNLAEASTNMTFTVSLDKSGIAPITVDYATSDGTAEAGSDYTSVSGTLTFASGETSKSVIVPISGDNILEADESFTVTLSNVTGTANLLDGSGTGVIENDDAASVTIADVATDEDNGTVTVTLSLDNGVQGGFTVNASTTDGTATTTDSDYTAISGEVLTFAGTAGETQVFDITLGVDAKLEANETLTVAMSTLAATTLGVDITDQATVTITNDDDASVTIADVSGNEDDGAITITATLDNPVDGGFSVDVSTSDGTATAGVDYFAVSSQTLTFAGTANETKAFTVTPKVDSDPEANETVNITVGNLAATSLAVDITDAAVLTIIDDDASSISIDDPTIAEGSSGNTDLTFTVSLDKPQIAAVTVDYAVTGGTATSRDDYTILADGTLTFAAGETSKTVVISVIGDTNVEPNETIELTLTNATGAALIADASGTATITNDDSAAVTIADISANEDDGTLTVTASLNNGVQGGFTVNASTTDATATTTDSDYTAISGEVLTFAGTTGETQAFDIMLGADTKLEANETLTVAMSTLAATTLGVDITDQATVTITNDDNASLTIADVSGNEDDGAITVTAVLDNPVAGGFSVNYASADGTATSSDDYTSVSGTLTFAGTVGESQEFTIVPTADLIDEGDETISISLASLSGTMLPVSISDEATITILDDDNTPVITTGQTFSIDETIVNNHEVGTILATDTDADTTFSNWTITEGNGDGIFAINSSTGEITVTDNTNLDYETKTSYSLTVTVSDGTNTSAGETVTVNVNNINDNTPVVTASQSFNINEDAANTTSVGTVAATDADAGTTLSDWTITEGNGDGIFAINSSTGEITVTDNTKLDYETRTSYYLTVTVSDGSHTSSSENISITVNDVFEKSDQSITFSQLADLTYGDSDFNLTATASSGLPVSYSSSNTSVATIDGNTVTIMGAGSTTITASQSGNASYNAATDVQQGLIVMPKALTIMADDKTKVYDGMVYSPFTVSYAGFVTGEDNTDLGGALTFSGTATTATDVRSDYVITPGGLISDNYAITFVDGTLSITKAAQIVTFNEIPLKHLETDPDFNLDATSSSGLAVTYSYSHSSTTAPAEVSPTGFVSLLASGEVEITVSQEGDNNYLPAEPVTRTMTIESSDASIHSITINGVTYDSPDQEIYYLIDCNDEQNKVEINFSTEANATGNTGLNFEIETPTPGIYRKEIQVTSQDNTNTRTYRVVVEKRFNYKDIVIQKYNNVLLVNNNPETNGGYRFTSFNWYKDGVLIGTGQYYSVGDNASDQLDLNAIYSVEMETEEGDLLSTCESSITLKSAFVLKVAPNPVHSGSTIDVTTTYSTEMLTDLKITVSNLYGLQVMQEVSGSNNSRITLPSSLTPGTYVISTKAGGVELSTKIIVQ